MANPLADHALNAAEASLLVLCLAIGSLLPPLTEQVNVYPVLVVSIGIVIAASLVLHLVFVGILARSLGRQPAKFVLLALLTLPIGSIVGLVLLEWQRKLAPPTTQQAKA